MKKRRTLIVCLLLMSMTITPLLFFHFGSQNALAQERESTWPSSVAITYGTASGILDYTVGQDGVTYFVAEEDTNSGTDSQHDKTKTDTELLEEYLSRAKLATEVAT